jgi:hypothetical protein
MLDPQRIGLNAASVGYLKRRRENVDWASFNKQLQTDDGGCINVRRTVETPVNEIHVMGGELKGLESNSNLLDRQRQYRQMNAYPLRSFSADAPAIILPEKYGGLPMYTRNQVEHEEYVSRFTEPMSAPLQRDTELLGRMGFSASNESASNPYRSLGFEMNMHKPKVAIDMNEAIIRQRRFLESSSRLGQSRKHNILTSGIFISANGDPITEVEDAVDSDRDTINAFHLHRARQHSLFERDGLTQGATARVESTGGMAMVNGKLGKLERVVKQIATDYRTAHPIGVAPVIMAMANLGPGVPALAGGGAAIPLPPAGGGHAVAAILPAGTGGAAAVGLGGSGATPPAGSAGGPPPATPLNLRDWRIAQGFSVVGVASKAQKRAYKTYVDKFVAPVSLFSPGP